MKKFYLFMLTAILLLSMVGCGKTTTEGAETGDAEVIADNAGKEDDVLKNTDDMSLTERYQSFVESGEYMKYIDKNWRCPAPDQYAILDIDGDSVDELIVANLDNEMGLCNYLAFGYDAESKTIYHIMIDASFSLNYTEDSNCGAFYWNMFYSNRYHALVFSELADMASTDYIGYWVKKNDMLSNCFAIEYGNTIEGEYISKKTDSKNNSLDISEEELRQYLDLEPVEFQYIKSASAQTDTSASSADLIDKAKAYTGSLYFDGDEYKVSIAFKNEKVYGVYYLPESGFALSFIGTYELSDDSIKMSVSWPGIELAEYTVEYHIESTNSGVMFTSVDGNSAIVEKGDSIEFFPDSSMSVDDCIELCEETLISDGSV